MNQYQTVIFKSRYARWLDSEGRRENFDETTSRVVDFWRKKFPELGEDLFQELWNGIYNIEAWPSMRLMWTAGPAVEANNIAAYNCAFVAVEDTRVFDEALRILGSGTGIGFSVETKYVSKLPIVNDTFVNTGRTIKIQDSRDGWGDALRKLIADLYLGREHNWDYSLIRPEGARLKTMGGRASGPDPLKDLFLFVTKVFKGAAGRKLTDLECHDIMTKIGEVIVVGGVRRSALISLSDLGSKAMAEAKSFGFGDKFPNRYLANNSAVYESKPPIETFMEEWLTLVKNRTGERGIFNRQGAIAKIRNSGRRNPDFDWGTNPCAEILLRPTGQFCNLSTVIIREDDTLESLSRKVRLAAIHGTLQSTLTKFEGLRPIWKKNTEEERLLGVSLMGTKDHPVLNKVSDEAKEWLHHLKRVAIETNIEIAKQLGINPSTGVTAVKPDGNSSQFANASSGLHARYSKYYIRSIRQANTDPITQFLKAAGVPWEPAIGAEERISVFYFPEKAAEHTIVAGTESAIEQLEYWKMFSQHYTEHNPSCTIYVRAHEWIEVSNWVYNNFDSILGVSFLPYDDVVYKQPVYDPITEEQYNAAVAKMPELDWSKLTEFEKEDNTEGAKTLACTAAGCEI